jgi:serine/threonine protein phosphatase 1
MNMGDSMKYYIISDIHSFYNEMIKSLQKSGFDSSNSNHHLLVLGDLFDRGPGTIEVLEYLFELHEKGICTIIVGNHDVFLLELIEEKYNSTLFNIRHNGHGHTLYQLTGIEPIKDNLQDIRSKILVDFPYLYDWISSFPLYLEIEDYVFVHGGIDGSNKEWKKNKCRRDFVWGKEYELPRIPTKTVVCGHTRVATIRTKTSDFESLYLLEKEKFDILELDGKTMIDRYVEISHELNVLILDL